MIKKITKVGNSQGVIFDAALMELAHLKPGDEVNVEVHAGAPSRSPPSDRTRRARKSRTPSSPQ
jgi:antitoxin component of MazEF toxin-antitoxin module